MAFSNDTKWGMKDIDWDVLKDAIMEEIDEYDAEDLEADFPDPKEFCEEVLGDDDEMIEFMVESYKQFGVPVCRRFT